MRNDGVLILVLQVAHNDKCFSLVLKHIFIDKYPTNLSNHKNVNVSVV